MKKWILAALLVLPLQAHAILINSSVGTFEVTTVNVQGKDSILRSTAWWGSASLAEEFAGLVNNDLGMTWALLAEVGPRFAYRNSDDDTFYAIYVDPLLGGKYVTKAITDEDDVHKYAISRVVGAPTAVPEPASLALLGIGLVALGFRRRFARR